MFSTGISQKGFYITRITIFQLLENQDLGQAFLISGWAHNPLSLVTFFKNQQLLSRVLVQFIEKALQKAIHLEALTSTRALVKTP